MVTDLLLRDMERHVGSWIFKKNEAKCDSKHKYFLIF